jgi:hypothetical protein
MFIDRSRSHRWGSYAPLVIGSHPSANALEDAAGQTRHVGLLTGLLTQPYFDCYCLQGVEVTGLGARIADIAIRALGRSALGLAYALTLAELILSLCMPSTTARAAGVFVPIITSLSKSFDSHPCES